MQFLLLTLLSNIVLTSAPAFAYVVFEADSNPLISTQAEIDAYKKTLSKPIVEAALKETHCFDFAIRAGIIKETDVVSRGHIDLPQSFINSQAQLRPWLEWTEIKDVTVACYYGNIPGVLADDDSLHLLVNFMDELDRFLESHGTKPIEFVFHNVGGDTNIAERIGDRIRERSKAGQKMIALVPDFAECSSACVSMYAAFPLKMAHPNARFGFHGYKDLSNSLSSDTLQDEQVQTLKNLGMDPAFLADLLNQGVFARREFTYPPLTTLKAAGLIDAIVPYDKLLSRIAP